MTVIAWDGSILAADKQRSYGDLAKTGTKIFRLADNEIIAFCGSVGTSLRMLDWYKNGAKADEWPEDLQNSDDWSQIILVRDGKLFWYDKQPYLIKCEDSICAFGVGCEMAIGAMAAGANAITAVNIVSQYIDRCGCGIDYFEVIK